MEKEIRYLKMFSRGRIIVNSIMIYSINLED